VQVVGFFLQADSLSEVLPSNRNSSPWCGQQNGTGTGTFGGTTWNFLHEVWVSNARGHLTPGCHLCPEHSRLNLFPKRKQGWSIKERWEQEKAKIDSQQ
jgi:hypothetical protein